MLSLSKLIDGLIICVYIEFVIELVVMKNDWKDKFGKQLSLMTFT